MDQKEKDKRRVQKAKAKGRPVGGKKPPAKRGRPKKKSDATHPTKD